MKWSFITAGCSFMRVLPQEFGTYQCGFSSLWSFIIVVFHQGGLHQGGLHQGGLSSVWSSSGWSSSGLFFIRVVFIRIVFHQGVATVQCRRQDLNTLSPVSYTGSRARRDLVH